jgi:hypothetical protein
MRRVVSLPNFLAAFSATYAEARERFLRAAEWADCRIESWRLDQTGPQGETLAVDVARWGNPSAQRWLLVTSGLHGTEAPFGSAAQIVFLQHLRHEIPDSKVGILFLHALNPYGFAWRRRTNEHNVDLNRNFLLPDQEFTGAHPLYHFVYERFDPASPPSPKELFMIKAWPLIMRHGIRVLRRSLPIGQYEYPKGLFFGGREPSSLQSLLREKLTGYFNTPEEVTHLDFHTGLGRWADLRLLMDSCDLQDDTKWYRRHVPSAVVEPVALNHTAYTARGTFGPWVKHHILPKSRYHYTAAEFGTYSVVRVMKALFDELRAHYALEHQHPTYEWAKRQICETFVPAAPSWRNRVMHRALDLCKHCLQGLREETAAPHGALKVQPVKHAHAAS